MSSEQKNNHLDKNVKGWIGYRPEIKVLDCTVRDGGLMNNHKFDDAFVKAVYQTCIEAGVDYMEMGYKANKKVFSTDEFGKFKFCDEDDIKKIIDGEETRVKLSVMADAERTDYKNDIIPCEQSVFDLIRVATYVHQVPTAIEMIKDIHDKGFEISVNLMSVSTVQEYEIDAALEAFCKTPVQTIYLVDSFGSLYSEQIQYLVKKYLSYAKPSGKTIGIHAHNNQQLAYSNTITALIEGANFLDATIDGMGRGAGNCPIELLLGFLHNPKFKIRPIIKCLQENVLPLKKELNWGCQVPYMLTGQINQHPRTAIKFLDSPDKEKILDFYDSLFEKD